MSLILVMVLITLSACGVKEGQTTFGSLQDKIDEYLIALDVTDYVKKQVVSDDEIIGYYENDNIKYILANILEEKQLTKYEFFFIDESLVYITENIKVFDKEATDETSIVVDEIFEEYILLDTRFADYNSDEETLVEREDQDLYQQLIDDFVNSLNNNSQISE